MSVSLRNDYSTSARGDACSVCGMHQRPVDFTDPNGEKELVVDLGVEIFTEGTFEVCEACMREVGSLLGMMEAGRAEGLSIENTALRSRATKAEKELEKAKAAFAEASALLMLQDATPAATAAAAAERRAEARA